MLILHFLAVVTQLPQAIREFGIIRGNQTTIAASAQVLARIETKRSRVTERTTRSAMICRTMRLTGIFDNGQPMSLGNHLDWRHIGRLTCKMNRNSRTSVRSNGPLDLRDIDIEGSRITIHQDRFSADRTDRQSRGNERVGWQDD